MPGRSTNERGREEEEAEEECRERQVRNEIVQEVVAGIKKKARVQVDAKQTAQRTVGQRVKQNWACSQNKIKRRRKMKTGKKGTRWKCNGLRMKSWKRSWNEEERKKASCRQKSCKKYLNWWYMSGCPNVKKRKA